MHPQLLDPVLDPDALLERLSALERARAEHPEWVRLEQGRYDEIRRALTDPAMRAHAPRARAAAGPHPQAPPPSVYLQPHAPLSQFQSVISECFEAELVSAGELEPSEHGVVRLLHEVEERFREFGPCDIRWIEPALLELATRLAGDKHPFPAGSAARVELGQNARVFVVGDWATGLPQARNVAGAIARQLADTPAGLERHVIHLGDTYYSGLEEEYTHRFLPLWPVQRHMQVGSWSLNGNHDMYAGGRGYFRTLLGDARFAGQGGRSYFCLGNESWQLIGLDSAYKDPDVPDLQEEQLPWLSALLEPADRPATILLTHHQPFSAWEAIGSPLAASVCGAVGERQVAGWLWGHEHRCAVYAPEIEYRAYHDAAAYTAIVGHGGVPNLLSGPEVPVLDALDASGVRWQNTESYTVGEDTWSYGGYAVIEIRGEQATIQYYDELGRARRAQNGDTIEPDVLPRP
jgi:hypothetical protein